MREIKEVLHLYTGCQMSTPYGECKFLYYKFGCDELRYNPVIVDRGDMQFAFKLDEVKPILRKLSDSTEEEKKEFNELAIRGLKTFDSNQFVAYDANTTVYLLSRGFDLFGLIDSGQAIDLSTLEGKDT